jgi:transposase
MTLPANSGASSSVSLYTALTTTRFKMKPQSTGWDLHGTIVSRIPPHSPDFNKPIEHVFHQMKDLLREKLYNCTEDVTAEMVQDWILEIWHDPKTITKGFNCKGCEQP